ncbi:MAG: hypothetical protein PHE17_06190 [Thiothrix sp.]|uniref:hypothetical protein n=1 Tax=Thiothrix sp. TaxID=1032 RepID=UPI002609781E|nr:hypothetical protein [Thiothrix sp.]MDD5392591.1 hypothetical protein [Thiothrix sp.]
MAKKFSELTAKMSLDAQAQAKAKLHIMLAEMPLYELRCAHGLSQKALLERRTDMDMQEEAIAEPQVGYYQTTS